MTLTYDKNISEVSGMIKKELMLINEWLQIDKWSLNISKTNYMIISSQENRYNPDNCIYDHSLNG